MDEADTVEEVKHVRDTLTNIDPEAQIAEKELEQAEIHLARAETVIEETE